MFNRRYQLLEQLGQGGMGIVYRAIDRLTGQVVAVKRLLPPQAFQPTNRESPTAAATLPMSEVDSWLVTRTALAHEFRTLAALRHPNIRSVLDFGFDGDQLPYLVMQYIDAPRDILAAARTLDLRGKVQLLIGVLQALIYLHKRRIVHRDLKPGNLLVDTHDVVQVVDFGVATPTDLYDAEAGQLVGSAPYLAPEVLRGDPPSPATDLYALGIIAYQMMVGRHPFNTRDMQHLMQETLHLAPDMSPVIDSSGIEIALIIERLLVKQPELRYHDARHVMLDLYSAVGVASPTEEHEVREGWLTMPPFVGRQQELAQLRAALKDAQAGHGSAWLVSGEAGVGKSRLMDEIRIEAMVNGFTMLHGRSQAAQESGHPYQLWHDPLALLALSVAPVALTSIDVTALQEIVPTMSSLVQPPEAEGTTAGTPAASTLGRPADRHQRLVNAVQALFAAHTEPMILLLEDLHWERGGLGLLRDIASMAATLPLLIIGSYRSEEAPYLYGTLPMMHAIRLPRLSADDLDHMARTILSERRFTADVIDFVKRQTEGNPLLALEVLRSMADQDGALESIGNREVIDQVSTQRILTLTLHRVQQLSDPQRALLEIAAIVGRDIDLTMLAPLASPDEIDDWLMVCGNAGLLDVRQGKWHFAHDLVRNCVLRQIPLVRLVELNRRVVQLSAASNARKQW